MTWTSYSLILQFCREERSVVICGDLGNLRHKSCSGWTEIFLYKFCPRVDWVNIWVNFILHLQADMEVADQNHQCFKFLLHHQGGRYTCLEHTFFTEQNFIKRDRHGNRIDAKLHTRRLPLDLWVESIFDDEFLCEENPIFHNSDVEICFSPDLYPPIPPEDRYPSCDYFYDDEDSFGFDCPCGGVNSDDKEVRICRHARDPYD